MIVSNIRYILMAVLFTTAGFVKAQDTSKAVGTPDGSLTVSDMGAAVYSLKFEVPDGGPLTPEIGLTYNSQAAGYGLAGYGFNITGISCITRGGKDLFHDGTLQGVTYTDDDTYFLDGKRLILESGNQGESESTYTLEGEPYTKVSLHKSYDNEAESFYFVVNTPNGTTYEYGNSENSCLSYTNSKGMFHIAAWYINKANDQYGNIITYDYIQNHLTIRPELIKYGLNDKKSRWCISQIEFVYTGLGSNSIPFVLEDQRGKADVRLSSVKISSNGSIFRRYNLQYEDLADQTARKWSRLVSVTVSNGNNESLNPIRFNWTFLQALYIITQQKDLGPIPTRDSYEATGDSLLYSADLNGDGFGDIVKILQLKRNERGTDVTRKFISFILSGRTESGELSYLKSVDCQLPQNCTMGGTSVLDFDGDGYNDYVVSYYYKHEHNDSVSRINNYHVFSGKTIEECDPTVSYDCNRNPLSMSILHRLKKASENAVFCSFDTNGDGKEDIVGIEPSELNGCYYGFIISHENSEIIQKDYGYSLPQKPKRLFPGDYNNDGLTDILILFDNGYKIYYNNGSLSAFAFSNNRSKTVMGQSNQSHDVLKDHWFVEQGDFNGDGMPDFVYNKGKKSGIYLAINNGEGNFTITHSNDMDFSSDKDNFFMFVLDYDHDGLSDLVVLKKKQKSLWYTSNGSSFDLRKSSKVTKETGNLFIGDFDGDGHREVANCGADINMYTENPIPVNKINVYTETTDLSTLGRIVSVTDGMGNKSSIQYGFLTDPQIYKQTSDGSYPVNTYTFPLSVVKKITTDNGTLGRIPIKYNYENLNVNLRGKGILGFGSVIQENETLETKAISNVIQWDNLRWIPTKTDVTSIVGPDTSKVISSISVSPVGNNYFSYIGKKEIFDLDGNKSIDSTQYDTEKGVILCETVTNVGTDMYKRVEYTYPDNPNEVGIWLPSTQTATQKHPDDPAPYTRITAYTYDSIGNMLTQTVNAGTDLALTTTHTYDVYGNVLSSVSTGNGVKPVISRNSYDTDGLHVVRTYTEPASTEYEYTYDRFGRVLTETDKTNAASPLVTTHTYDGWGRRTSTLTPDSLLTTYSIGWTSAGNSRYYTSETCAGQPPVTTWYDKSGRELESLTKGPKNTDIRKTTAYNSKGQVSSITRQTGTLTLSQSFTYDERGRVTEETFSSGKTVHHTYGNRSETVTVGDRSHTTETDAWGNVIRTTDPSGSVEYTYSSAGLPVRVSSHGTEVTMTYDAAGNRTSLTDPDAGTMTYSYAADGTLLTQTDGRNITTVNTYDDLGRLTKTVTGSQEITYQYGTEGNAAMRLTGKSLNGNTISYTYDRLGRITGEQRVTRGQTVYTCGYTYNSLGQLSRQIYNSDIYVDYEYDTCGYRNQTVANGYVLYRREQYSGYTDSFSHGQLLTTYSRNNKGYETERRITKGYTTLAQFQMTHDVNTDNLLTRRRDSNLQESFTYDNLDRLLSVSTGGTPNMQMTYQPNGNIIRKTDVGIYTYNTDGKPHAVRRVDSLSVVPVSSLLRTEFNDLGKIQRITYDATRRQMEFEYGPDRERWYSVLTDSIGAVPTVRTIYYAGDYEKVTEDCITTEFYYLDGNAILVKRGDTLTPYLAFTDNLGSILSILDRNGESVYEATYDVWGQQEVTLNEIGFHRGYTGHEMLPEFGIINMNGRLYDPMLGRFLSPDNYVQSPTNSQNFNRYSYCLNNPLKYTDPSGEWFHILVGAIIGSVMGTISSNIKSINNGDNFGKFMWKGFLAGHIGGIAGAAAAASGGAVAGSLGSVGAIAGFTSGTASGMAGGFIGSAGNAWMDGHGLIGGLRAGKMGSLYGAAIGGVMGGLQSGISAVRHDGNFFTGKGAKYDALEVDFSKIPNNKEPRVAYSNKSAKAFSDKYFGEIEHVDNLYADGSLPDGYELRDNGYVYRIGEEDAIAGSTVYNGFGKGSDVFLYQTSFRSFTKLYLTMGHEYMHAYYNAIGLNGCQDIVHGQIYRWQSEQATIWRYESATGLRNKFAEAASKYVIQNYESFTNSQGKQVFQILPIRPWANYLIP